MTYKEYMTQREYLLARLGRATYNLDISAPRTEQWRAWMQAKCYWTELVNLLHQDYINTCISGTDK